MGNEKYVMLVNDINKDDSYEIELLCSFELKIISILYIVKMN